MVLAWWCNLTWTSYGSQVRRRPVESKVGQWNAAVEVLDEELELAAVPGGGRQPIADFGVELLHVVLFEDGAGRVAEAQLELRGDDGDAEEGGHVLVAVRQRRPLPVRLQPVPQRRARRQQRRNLKGNDAIDLGLRSPSLPVDPFPVRHPFNSG